MVTHQDERAAAELARASRLEAMANNLLIEAREIRSCYAKPKKKQEYRNLVEIAKAMGERR
jgi:hypothetical protein